MRKELDVGGELIKSFRSKYIRQTKKPRIGYYGVKALSHMYCMRSLWNWYMLGGGIVSDEHIAEMAEALMWDEEFTNLKKWAARKVQVRKIETIEPKLGQTKGDDIVIEGEFEAAFDGVIYECKRVDKLPTKNPRWSDIEQLSAYILMSPENLKALSGSILYVGPGANGKSKFCQLSVDFNARAYNDLVAKAIQLHKSLVEAWPPPCKCGRGEHIKQKIDVDKAKILIKNYKTLGVK